MPLANISDLTLLYKKGWCILTGLSFCAPHPHRHFTEEEFNLRIKEDNDFYNYLNEYK